MGTLAKEIGSRLAKELHPRSLQKREAVVGDLWDNIETMLAEVAVPHARVRFTRTASQSADVRWKSSTSLLKRGAAIIAS